MAIYVLPHARMTLCLCFIYGTIDKFTVRLILFLDIAHDPLIADAFNTCNAARLLKAARFKGSKHIPNHCRMFIDITKYSNCPLPPLGRTQNLPRSLAYDVVHAKPERNLRFVCQKHTAADCPHECGAGIAADGFKNCIFGRDDNG